MKNKLIAVLIIFAAVITTNAAAYDTSDYLYTADIEIVLGKSDFSRLTLTPPIYDKSSLSLDDIRIIAPDSNQLPYIITKPRDITVNIPYTPEIINRTTSDENAAAVTLDFREKTIKNYIEVSTEGKNFRRPVTIEGSNDNTEFFTLVRSAFVFAIDYDKQHRFNAIDMPENDYRYLRIIISPMASEKDPPAISSVKAFKKGKQIAPRETLNMLLTSHHQDPNKYQSIYEYDLNYKNIPLTEIDFDIPTESFYRYITVTGRNQLTKKVRLDSEDNTPRFREVNEPFQHITSGVIYRYENQKGEQKQKLFLDINSKPAYRYLKITINNYDNLPIDIASASARFIPHELLFESAWNTTAAIYFGNPKAVKPKFDINLRISDPQKIDAQKAFLTDVKDNPAFAQKIKNQPWTEKHKILLWLIMIAVVVILAVFIAKSFKSIQNQTPE